MAQKRSPHFSSTPSFSQPTCVCVLLCTYDVSGLVKLCIFFILGMFSQDLWPKPIGFVCVCIVIWCSLLLPSLSWHFPRHWVISCSITVGLNQMSSPPSEVFTHPLTSASTPLSGSCGNCMAAYGQSSHLLTAWILSFFLVTSDQPVCPLGFYLPLAHFLAKGLETQSEMTGEWSWRNWFSHWVFEQLASERKLVNFFLSFF